MRKSKRVATKREVARNKEEEAVLMMYRSIARWEKNALHLLMWSLAWGEMVAENTDHLSWESIRRTHGLPAPRKAVSHEG